MGRMRVCDFFCGGGGFSEGFRQNGFDVVLALDNWKPAIETHNLNHPKCNNVLMNILELDAPEKIDEIVPDTEVIIGSPPCVSFSGSNKAGKADKSLGIKLIEAYLRIVLWKQSKGVLKYWILENVPNSGKYIKDSYSWKELGLPGSGPTLKVPVKEVLNAAYYGAAQGRKRFVCGEYPTPKKTHNENNWISTKHVLDTLGNPLEKPKSNIINDPIHPIHVPSSKLTDHYYDSRVPDFEWKKAKRLKVDHGFMGKMSFPEDLDRPSRTIMATMSSSTRESMIFAAKKNGRKVGYRAPTIREVSSLMGFPINYQFAGGSEIIKYKQVGNAVCVPLSSALAKSILKSEKKRIPKYIPLGEVEVPLNLNGITRVFKKPKPRLPDAKFAVHVPHLKIKSMRVELNNKQSDFDKGLVVWKSLLHHGSGKEARVAEVPQRTVYRWFLKNKEFSDSLNNSLSEVKTSHKELQKQYVMNGSATGVTPNKVLALIKEEIDSHFPEEEFQDKTIEEPKLMNYVGRSEIPIRVAAALYACNKFVNSLRN